MLAYMSSPCHIELTLVEQEKQVEKPATTVGRLSKRRLVRLRGKN
jgi:hypothetical protein